MDVDTTKDNIPNNLPKCVNHGAVAQNYPGFPDGKPEEEVECGCPETPEIAGVEEPVGIAGATVATDTDPPEGRGGPHPRAARRA